MESARSHTRAVALVALALVAIAAAKATYGISFFDDAYYAAVPMRLANGSRLLTDEMTPQSLGFLLAVPFTWAWKATFGMSGLVLALRLYYVVLATATGVASFLLLRPSFRAVPAALAVTVPLLCPPYSILGVSYNTTAQMSFMLALALTVAALRDRRAALAALAGGFAAFGAVSYPPLGLAALAFFTAAAWVSRDRRIIGAALGGAAVVLAAAVAFLLATSSIADARIMLDYSSAAWAWSPISERIVYVLDKMRDSMGRLTLLPMWALAIVAAWPWRDKRVGAWSAAAIPLAAALPPALRLASGADPLVFGVLPSTYALTFLAGALVPAVAFTRRARRPDLTAAFVLGASFSAVAVPLVALSTSAGWHWGLPVVGATPLLVAVLVAWAMQAEEGGGRACIALGALALLGAIVALLFSLSFKDEPPGRLTARIRTGALAGIATTPQRAAEIAGIEAASARLIKPSDRVLVVNGPLGYLLTGGVPHANAAWIGLGPHGTFTVDYFGREGAPDVILLARNPVNARGGLAKAAESDPLVAYAVKNFRIAEEAPRFTVFVRR